MNDPWCDSKPCSDCGALSESGYFDVGLHDCETGEWIYLVFTIPESRWLKLTQEERDLWPTDRIRVGK